MTQYSPRKNNISLTHSTRKTQKALHAQDLSMANPNVFVTKTPP